MILDQNRAVLVASVIYFQKIFGLHGLNHQIIEYLVSRGRYWLVLGVTGSEQAVLVASMMSFQKIYGLHGLNHQIIEYSKKEKVMTDKSTDRPTDRISSCRLDPFCRRG